VHGCVCDLKVSQTSSLLLLQVHYRGIQIWSRCVPWTISVILGVIVGVFFRIGFASRVLNWSSDLWRVRILYWARPKWCLTSTSFNLWMFVFIPESKLICAISCIWSTFSEVFRTGLFRWYWNLLLGLFRLYWKLLLALSFRWMLRVIFLFRQFPCSLLSIRDWVLQKKYEAFIRDTYERDEE